MTNLFHFVGFVESCFIFDVLQSKKIISPCLDPHAVARLGLSILQSPLLEKVVWLIRVIGP